MTSTHPSHDPASPVCSLSARIGFHFISAQTLPCCTQLIPESNSVKWNTFEGTSSEGWEVLIGRRGGGGSVETVSSFSPEQIFSCKTPRESVWLRFPSKVLGRMIGPGGFDISCSRVSHKQREVKSMLLSHFQSLSSLTQREIHPTPPLLLSSVLIQTAGSHFSSDLTGGGVINWF